MYWRKLKLRLKAEGNETVTRCRGVKWRDAALQKRVRTERQFNRQLELNNEARVLKKKVAEMEKLLNRL